MKNRQNWGSYRPTEEWSPNDFIAAIAEQISYSPLSVLDIEDLVQKYGPRANCHPGEPSTTCCDGAIFVSLSSKSYRKGRGHYYFKSSFSTCRELAQERQTEQQSSPSPIPLSLMNS